MPASFTIDPARRIVISRAWGVLGNDDLSETQVGLRADPSFAADFSQLWDFSEVTRVELTGARIRDLSATSPFLPTARRAIVADTDEKYGMARMYALVGDRDETSFRIFRDRESALAWLLTP